MIVASPSDEWLAWSSYDGIIRLYRRVGGSSHEEVATFKAHQSPVGALAFSRYAPILASTGIGDNAVRLWRVPSCEPIAALGGFTRGIGRMVISPDGRIIAATGREGVIRVWDLQSALDAAPHATAPR